MNATGLAGDRGEKHFGRRNGEIVPMVLADAEKREAQLVGQHRFGDDVAQDLMLRQSFSVGAERHVSERIKTELDHRCDPPRLH